MTGRSSRLSRKELYTGAMVLFIGLFYFLTIAVSIFQTDYSRFDRGEMKMFMLSLFYLAAGILFLLRKNAGWIMSTAILFNFVFVMMVLIISLSQAGAFSVYALMAVFLFLLILLSFLFLFSKETRKKYMVNNKSYLITLLLAGLTAWANFVLK
jgi:hypothetical protein